MSALERQAETGKRDGRLVAASVGGELRAFDELVEIYQGMVYSVAYGFLGNPDDAEDASQETFLRAHRSLKGLRNGSGFKPWLGKLALNVCKDMSRKKATRRTETRLAFEEMAVAREANPAESADRAELREYVRRAVRSLPEYCRMVLVLYDLEGMDYAQISSTMQIRIGTVRSRLSRARKLLRTKLREVIK